MYLKQNNVCIFEPDVEIDNDILKMQKQMGDNVTALITPDTYFVIREYYSDRVKDYDTKETEHVPITRFENVRGVVDFIVVGDVYE